MPDTYYGRRKPRALRLLVVEEDPLLRMDICIALENADYVVAGEVGNGCDAVEAALALRPDLVISEVKLPGQDGIAVAEILYRERIAPVVLLTAHSHKELVQRAARAGVQSYLVKPFREAALITALEVAHSQWQTLREQERKVQFLQEKEETRDTVDRAKRLLMASCGMNETRAYRYLQARSMQTRRSMKAVAGAILITHEITQSVPGPSGAEAVSYQEAV